MHTQSYEWQSQKLLMYLKTVHKLLNLYILKNNTNIALEEIKTLNGNEYMYIYSDES